MKAPNRVAINSLALYANMAVSMGVSLLATRYVLEALGSTDFGIYALIANIVAMFSFLNVAMAAASQRYLSYVLGSRNKQQMHEVFYNSLLIHWCIALAVMVFLLAGGLLCINHLLDIAPTDISKARCVLLCMMCGVVFTIIAVPYEADLNAHEDIFWIAGINSVEALLKLASAIGLLFIDRHRLVIYALAIAGISLFAFICKWGCCRRYEECHYRLHRINDFRLIKGMTGFAGWNLIGAGASIARFQGAAILLNLFFGLAVNAAYGVAQQVNGFLLFFANSTIRPIRPQIIKNEGSGQHQKVTLLSFSACRITYLLLALLIIPLYLNMPLVLRLWLKEVPENTLAFCRLFLLITLLVQLSIGLNVALEAIGRIKKLQQVVGSLHLISLPAGYLLFRMGCPAVSILYCVLAEEGVATLLRAFIAQKDAGVPLKAYWRQVALPCLGCSLFVFGLTMGVSHYVATNEWALLWVSSIMSTLLLSISGYRICLSPWEREKIHTLFASIRAKKL